jgi:hypothetical protein
MLLSTQISNLYSETGNPPEGHESEGQTGNPPEGRESEEQTGNPPEGWESEGRIPNYTQTALKHQVFYVELNQRAHSPQRHDLSDST